MMKLNNSFKTEDPVAVQSHIDIYKCGNIPRNLKGDVYNDMHYIIEDSCLLLSFFNAFIKCNCYEGNLTVESDHFDDNIGFSIVKIIQNNKVGKLRIYNRTKPLSDRLTSEIGKALLSNTCLTDLDIFLEVGPLSHTHIVEFLTSHTSNLKKLKYLKIVPEVLTQMSIYFSDCPKLAKLEEIGFYYHPLLTFDLLYDRLIDEKVYNELADHIESKSNLLNVEIVPLLEKYDEEINTKLVGDIDTIIKTLNFACENNQKVLREKINIDDNYNQDNERYKSIIENLGNGETQSKNSIISVRSYLKKTIGEYLNNALYELEIQREKINASEELFTAKGSIRYIAKFLSEKNTY